MHVKIIGRGGEKKGKRGGGFGLVTKERGLTGVEGRWCGRGGGTRRVWMGFDKRNQTTVQKSPVQLAGEESWLYADVKGV